MFDYGRDYIHIINDFIDDADIDTVVKYMNTFPDSEDQREIKFIEDIDDESIVEIIKKYEKKAYSEIVGKYAPSLNLRIEYLAWMRRLELVKWNHDTGLQPHRDGHLHTPAEPELSLSSLIYLTDKFDGGEVCFQEFGLDVKPKRGDFIIFPSHFLHEVTPTYANEYNEYRFTIPFFYTFNARKFTEFTHPEYVKQVQDHNSGVGEYATELKIER